jgi:hypothetical protein
MLFSCTYLSELYFYSPKSVYAKILTGDKVFKRLHPLLSDTSGFVSVRHDLGPDSLLLPKTNSLTKTSEAVFVVEAVLDLDSNKGRQLAKSFISTMVDFPAAIGDGDESSPVSVAYRLLPSMASPAAISLCAVLSRAEEVGAASLIELLESLPDEPDQIIEAVHGVSDDVKRSIMSRTDSCATMPHFQEELPSSNFVAANGRVYSLDNASIGKDDIELLLTMELKRAKAVTKLLSPHLGFDEVSHYDAVAQAAVFLALSESDQESRSDIQASVRSIEDEMRLESNPFRFSWNQESSDGELRVRHLELWSFFF